ncbi:MAG: hypothetical protein PHU42_01945 [Patescibacteria group bacterium]|nr:hypothetical protein [Patescibacteria group bacterium]
MRYSCFCVKEGSVPDSTATRISLKKIQREIVERYSADKIKKESQSFSSSWWYMSIKEICHRLDLNKNDLIMTIDGKKDGIGHYRILGIHVNSINDELLMIFEMEFEMGETKIKNTTEKGAFYAATYFIRTGKLLSFLGRVLGIDGRFSKMTFPIYCPTKLDFLVPTKTALPTIHIGRGL